MKRYLWILGTGLITPALFYICSPRRDAEAALGLKWLPWSTANLSVTVDAWTDYVVRGYIEVSPGDFEKILSARPYEREDHPARMLSGPFLPESNSRMATSSYWWSNGDSNCRLQADETRSWIWFSYSTE